MFRVFDLSVVEIGLIQIVFYSLLWLWDDFIATYLTLAFACMFAVILLISVIVEWIDPSRVPRKYFLVMLISVAVPIGIGIFFYFLLDGQLSWLEI